MYTKNQPNLFKDPKRSEAFESLRESDTIKSIKKIGSFDGKPNGLLNLWRLHANSYDMYVALIVDGHVIVEVNLRCDDHALVKPYLEVLKDEARSVRIIRNGGSHN